MTDMPGTVKRAHWGLREFTLKVAALRSLDLTSLATHTALITALCLQRFGVPFGGATLSISLPALLLLTLWLVMKRRAYAPARTVLLFGLFIGWALLSTLVAVMAPDPRVGFSIFSFLELVGLYLPLLIRPWGEFDSLRVQRIFLFYVRACALLGIAQFFLQFVHVRLFSISERFPGLLRWLLEPGYATVSPIKYGSQILRSDGLFLLEPSIFSQVLAIGVLVDVFLIGSKRYLPLYAIAYLTTFSGTGALSLALTLSLIGLTSTRNATRVLLLGLAGCAALVLMALVAPGLFATFAGRAGELQSTQTSAYVRYFAPFAELRSFAGETRLLLGYGPGATARATTYMAGSGSAALQLVIDYGAVGALLFGAFVISALWRTRYAALSIMLLVTFQFGGGYLLTPPIVVLMGVLGIWGTETPIPGLAPRRSYARRRCLGHFARVRHGTSILGEGQSAETA